MLPFYFLYPLTLAFLCLFHVSRHTFATNLANNGANEFEIAQLLGDKKLDMVRIYVNNDAKGLKVTMAKVWNNMKKSSQKETSLQAMP